MPLTTGQSVVGYAAFARSKALALVMTLEPIRVGLLVLGVGPSPSGVWTRLRYLVSALMAEPGVELFAVVTNESERTALGLPENRTLVTPPMNSFQRMLRTSRIARSFVEQFDLDLLQVESKPIPRVTAVPLLFSLHDLRTFDTPARQLRSLGECYTRILLPRRIRNVAAVLSLTAWMKHEIEHRLLTANVHVVPPIAPHAAIPSAPSMQLKAAADLRQPFVVAIGHLEPRKNIEVLIRASQEPTWPGGLGIIIAGADHGSLPHLQQIATASTTQVTFVGQVSDGDKWWLLSHAAIVAVPSLIEGFGIVALESILVGTPVLVSDAAALPEVVGDQRAALPPDGPEAWSQRIRDLVSDPQFRSSLIGREASIIQRHTVASVVAQVMDIYRSLATPESE